MSEYKERYPWLRLQNLYTGKLYQERDAVDEMKEFAPGWFIAFGEMMLEELDEAIQEVNAVDTFVIGQIKEKFGQLKIYHNQGRDSKVESIVQKHEFISAHVCIRCGAPDVPMLHASWIRPMCRDCYMKSDGRNTSDYDDVSSETTKIPDERVWETFVKLDEETKKSVYETHKENISETVERIRDNWNSRQKEKMFADLMIKYPWSKSNAYEEDDDNAYCMLEDIPEGWFVAFGEMMCEEIDVVLKEKGLVNEFRFIQIKEKYGELRMYASVYIPEVEEIIEKYSLISSNICLHCGEIDVPMIDIHGWISPYCKNCYTKIINNMRNSTAKTFEEITEGKETNMAEEIVVRSYSQKDGHTERRINIHSTVDKIRKSYQNRKDSQI